MILSKPQYVGIFDWENDGGNWVVITQIFPLASVAADIAERKGKNESKNKAQTDKGRKWK